MLTLCLVVFLFAILGKILTIALEVSWGILKVIGGLVLIPLALVIFVYAGAVYLAVAVLLFAGIGRIMSACLFVNS